MRLDDRWQGVFLLEKLGQLAIAPRFLLYHLFLFTWEGIGVGLMGQGGKPVLARCIEFVG